MEVAASIVVQCNVLMDMPLGGHRLAAVLEA